MDSLVGIVGGKFGVYAWLPAILDKSFRRVVIEGRHIGEFNKLPELQQYFDQIIWVKDSQTVIDMCDVLILAIPPSKVYNYLPLILGSSIKKLIVEKPICETPEKSEKFIKQIEEAGIKIISTYLFFYTDWYLDLVEYINNVKERSTININWFFKADHFKYNKDNWKKYHNQGGGSLRFYGIHLVALLAKNDYSIKNTFYINSHFNAVFTSPNKPNIEITVESNWDRDLFSITYLDKRITKLTNPFDLIDNQYNDSRIKYLKNLLLSLDTEYEELNSIMKKTNELWKNIEEKMSLS